MKVTFSKPEVFLRFRNFSTRQLFQKRQFIILFLLAIPFSLLAQQSIKGTVKDTNGEPLTGVSVNVKNTSIGTSTDKNGNYSIFFPNATGNLVFSFVGFETKEVNVQGKSSIDITLEGKISNLNEVVITGYRSQERTTLTT